MATNTVSRAMHDVGLAAWFGGTLANAVALNPAAALGDTAYSRVLGKKVSARTDVPAASGTEPTASTPDDVAAAQKQLKALQWAIPALTGVLLVISAYAGEQQRASEVHKGVLQRITPGA